MNNSTTFNICGHRLLVTRPAAQSAQLIHLLEHEGVIALQLPTLEIKPLRAPEVDKYKILNLDQYDAVIAVSTNAANIGLEWIDSYWPQLPQHIQWFAVGNATAAILGQRVGKVQAPSDSADTEGLLALPELEQSGGKKILILKGRGGRQLLQESLTERGCRVDTLDLYYRARPTYSRAEIEALFVKGFPDSVLVTSRESLENLCEILRDYRHKLALTRLITVSERISTMARKKGFNCIHTARGASGQAIIQALNVIA